MVLSSCESRYPTTPTKFIIEEITRNQIEGTNLYFIVPIRPQGLSTIPIWVVDSVGKFNVGDTLVLQPIR